MDNYALPTALIIVATMVALYINQLEIEVFAALGNIFGIC